MHSIHHTLKYYFGCDSFRPGQENLIKAILSGRDTLGIMPTGAGKSLCYQIPALTFPGLTLVISPLISLMQDQVAALKRRGIGAEFINSAIDFETRESIQRRILKEYGGLDETSDTPRQPSTFHFSKPSTPDTPLRHSASQPSRPLTPNTSRQPSTFQFSKPSTPDTPLWHSVSQPSRPSTPDTPRQPSTFHLSKPSTPDTPLWYSASHPSRPLTPDTPRQPIKLLYISPERLSSPAFRAFARKIRISFICIDEAHCISLWGQQFRPDYLKIAEFVEILPIRPVLAGFTATANTDVRNDIIDRLRLKNPYVQTIGFDRPNLFFEIQKPKDKWFALCSLLTCHRGECGIIYCLTRRTVESLSKKLAASGIAVSRYHGGMELTEREANQRDWLTGRRSVIVATNAFGMGIDKPDVRFVIHYNMPGCMENYYQEAGRAGRDGLPSDCILLYSYRDVVINQFFISRAGILPAESVKEGNHRSVSAIEGVYVAIDDRVDLDALRANERRKLAAMQQFVSGDVCLRRYMLDYFGEHAPAYCGKCSRCLSLLPFGRHYTSLTPDVESADLFNELRALRLRLSRKYKVLPHKIFTDRTLHDFARARPCSVFGMLLIEGAGVRSCLKYGREFAAEIRLFVETN